MSNVPPIRQTDCNEESCSSSLFIFIINVRTHCKRAELLLYRPQSCEHKNLAKQEKNNNKGKNAASCTFFIGHVMCSELQ